MRQKLRGIRLSDTDWQKLEDYAQYYGLPSRAEAIRKLIDQVVWIGLLTKPDGTYTVHPATAEPPIRDIVDTVELDLFGDP